MPITVEALKKLIEKYRAANMDVNQLERELLNYEDRKILPGNLSHYHKVGKLPIISTGPIKEDDFKQRQ